MAVGRQSEVKTEILSVTNEKVEDPEENKDGAKFDPVNEPDETQNTEKNNQSTEGASEIRAVPSEINEEVTPELTLVLFGDPNSVEIGSKNILLDHDEQLNVEKFSSKLYDLCGRQISVINLLSLQNIDRFPLNKGINAFLLLLPNGCHYSQYSAGVQWIEKAFGRGSLDYLMTVVTHESDETCESTLTDLKANSSFSEKRYHTCTRSMNNEKEIIDLLEKIDVMVSENDPRCYMKLMSDENKEQESLDYKSHEEERINSSEFQKNQTGYPVTELQNAAVIKFESVRVKEPGDVKHSEKNDDYKRGMSSVISVSFVTKEKVNEQGTEESAAKTAGKCDSVNVTTQSHKSDDSAKVGGESEIQSVKPSAPREKGEPDEVKDSTNESSSNMSEPSMEESDAEKDANPTSQTVSTDTKEMEDMEKRRNVECVPVNEADVEHTDKNDKNTRRENDIQTPQFATSEKGNILLTYGTSDVNMSGNKDEQQSREICAEIDKKKQYQREIETLLGRLHLKDKQKFTPADFLSIGPPVKLHHETCEKDLVHTFLRRLMMLDYRARYIPVRQDSPELSHSKHVTECDTDETNEDDLDTLYTARGKSNQSKQSHVHPMDVQMAVFHCSDSFFKQNLITKLSQCQYALPLLVPDPVTKDIDCPLWTFRQITKTWKIKDNSNTVTMKSLPICKAKTPMVSFFRLGSLSVSKSQLMNILINDRHSTFFHRNCPGSTKSRHLMNGVAEIAWYCPAGKPNDAFTDCTAFCNLHGDALSNEKQREILTEKSSVNVFLVPTLEKGNKCETVISALYKSKRPLILLIADNDCSVVETKKGKFKMGLNDKSLPDVSEELKGIIRNILTGPHSSFQLETMAEVSGIRVDEDDTVCKKGKTAAMEIINLFKGMDVSMIKKRFFHYQGHLWHEWCRIHQELYRLKGNVEMEKSKKEQELLQIRQRQCTASFSEVMKLFIKSLSSFSSSEKDYFLKWTQILIDELSTDDLSKILQRCDEKWSEVIALKKKHDKSDQMKLKQTELDQISAKLQSATFGLEHIFREMGQIYEAHASLQKQRKRGQTDWSKYPELAAELMISGHPMELMDGDAGHVPLTWICSLLDEIIKKLGDKKVFVLSVLGVQSSGKSTMLNAMFGLQFAVSAGRCTKGAFMQLVEVSEEIKKDLRFDYILVVDTEGLRALELAGEASLHRDNELATFVVGLGNMTLINIFGENPADMQDVLQIVVQAFMRMKRVKLFPSCVFVHQNVTDVAAAEKNMDGKRRLQEKLDQMAELAAKEEVSDAKCFSDVIAFDVQKDVKYFAQLWEGSPPMAPPNPGYSESVQDLKEFILSKVSKSDGITLSHFKSKIQDLWNALLNENFVFSFKNTLEIAVYRKLETQYGNWTWELRNNMLIIENQHHTRIENGKLDKIELNALYKDMSKTYEKIQTDMTTYFDDDDGEKEILVQWRGRFEIKIKEFHDDQVRDVQRKLNEVIQHKNARKKLDDKKTEFENKLLQQSKDLAHQLKDKTKDEEELRNQFNSVWSHLVSELTADTRPIKEINLEEDQTYILQELGVEQQLIDESRSSDRYKKIAKVGDYFKYVTFSKHRDTSQKSSNKREKWDRDRQEEPTENILKGLWLRGSSPFEENQMIRSFAHNTEQQTIDIVKSKPVATRGYSATYLKEVANYVKDKVTEFESERKYALKKEFMVDLTLHVLDRAGYMLSEGHRKFKKNNDALTYLESKKTQYYDIFRSFCKGSSSAVVLGEMICEKLKSSTVEAVCNKTAIDLAHEMKCNFPAFSGNRLDLEKHVLKSLAEKENFDDFITYIHQPKKQVETFIKEEVEKYIFTENKDKAQKILKKNAEDIKKLVSQALFTATEKVDSHKGDIDMWVKEFSSLIRDQLKFTISCQNFSDINNLAFLKEEIEKGFDAITKKMSSLSLEKIKEFRLTPDQILIDQLCKCCWVTCPFCAAVCTNTLEDHSPDDHSVPFHRPSGIEGWHRRNTVELSVNFCTTKVESDRSFYPTSDSDEAVPYKQYQTAGPKYANWRITPDESKLIYWKWFVCRFQKQLEDHYKLKFEGRGEIPSEWRQHTKEEAIDSLDEICDKLVNTTTVHLKIEDVFSEFMN